MILGFYTLSATSVPLDLLPEGLAKKIHYPQAPAALIGRLAIGKGHPPTPWQPYADGCV